MEKRRPNHYSVALFCAGILIGTTSVTLSGILQDAYGIAPPAELATGLLDLAAFALLLTIKPAQVIHDGSKGFILPAVTWIRIVRGVYLAILSIMLVLKVCTPVLLLWRLYR